jgi:serine/threonine protein kinase
MESIGECEYEFGGKFRLVGNIDSGSTKSGALGHVYKGTDVHNGEKVAIKLEAVSSAVPQLFHECKLYRILEGCTGVAKLHWCGVEHDYNVMVMDLLGPSLEDLFNFYKRKFNLKTVLMLADQIISRIEIVHAHDLIHRDIKPSNFVVGLDRSANLVHMVDFGHARPFRHPETEQHIPYREGENLVGMARYASVNAHLGVAQSRRDDLEAIGYMLIYFLRGDLPWQGLQAHGKQERCDKVKETKLETPIDVLCGGFPKEFAAYLTYCRGLGFYDRPDYSFLRRLFKTCSDYSSDYAFEWTVLESPLKQED